MNYSFILPSILIQLVIMGYYFFRPRLPIRLNRAFLAILVIDIGMELFDCVSALMNETWSVYSPALLTAVYMLYYIFFFSHCYMFFVFTVSILDSRVLVRSKLNVLAPIVYIPCIAVALTTPLTGWLFRADQGFRPGPVAWFTHMCSLSYLLYSTIAVLRHLKELSTHEIISLLAMQGVLLAGIIVQWLVPDYIIFNTFCLLAIIVIFISFLNPERFLSDHSYVFNLPGFRALMEEYYRRHRNCRVLGFTIQNYSEHREIFGSRQTDEALSAISRWLSETFSTLTIFYVHNGSFMLVGQNRPDLNVIRDRIRERFARPWVTILGDLKLSVSFVEADTEALQCPADSLINTLMISQAEAEHGDGRDSSRSLSDFIEEINRKLDIRKCLEKALEEDSLEVFLQPLIDCKTGRRIAAEALVRLRDEHGTLIRPDLFIDLAEREGHIVQLGEQVLCHVCRFIRDNDMEALGIQWINVNLSPVQFMSQDIPAAFARILQQYEVDEKMIHLEITEQSMIDFSLLREQIMGLHEKGFEFALDDYGSGYSNLSRVRQYPFSNIKIDMDVVRNYCREPDPLLPALVRGFKQMRLTITAEGIETPEMANALKAIGCDYLQGYFFSRPVPMQEFLQMPA